MLQQPKKIEKLRVLAYKSTSRNGRAQSFSFLFNPDTLRSTHENFFGRAQGINTSGRTAPYKLSRSDQLALQLTLDNTLARDFLPGTPPITAKGTVKEQVDHFLKYCFYMDGDIHEPRFLVVEWGKFAFECRLKSIAVNYTHFDTQGEALRAKLDAVFIEDIPEDKRIRLENKKSPDITHSRMVKAGDTLTTLAREVYGDARHYLLVARANQLKHFRRLVPGQQLRFPPLDEK